MLNALTGARPAWPGAALIDPSRIAMAGHSIGGAAAISILLGDSRILAGIDMDGTIPTRSRSRVCHGRFSCWESNRITPREAVAR